MKQSVTTLVALIGCVAFAAIVILPLVSLPTILYFVIGYGCGPSDDRMAERLATLGILDARPAGARQGERESHCEDDARATTVSQTYWLSGSETAADAYYRKAARRDGWTASKNEGCFVKAIDEKLVTLVVTGLSGNEYEVRLMSTPGSSLWC
ncbi:hypothetical protein [Spongiactinospora sp. TRM90649]|uniref:hypothetical protein n=1 Tax=Spongiactinospora sp. TRM90649 TaxID=3031114 RepID=UPI0023F63143|nr:hypothetical protein [Spongiactinospora sp. TRM90649]MDF5754491.1 hypothetical protein [Spongiactinospora sp. TRM90649]